MTIKSNYEEPAVVGTSFIGSGEGRMSEDVAGVDGAIASAAVDVGQDARDGRTPTQHHQRQLERSHDSLLLHRTASSALLTHWTPRRRRTVFGRRSSTSAPSSFLTLLSPVMTIGPLTCLFLVIFG